MRLLICAGGTGGGVYPALAVLQALPSDAHPSILWVGSAGGMERELVERAQVPFEAIPAAGVHGVGLRSLPGNLLQLARGYRSAAPDPEAFPTGCSAFHRRLCSCTDGVGRASMSHLSCTCQILSRGWR